MIRHAPPEVSGGQTVTSAHSVTTALHGKVIGHKRAREESLLAEGRLAAGPGSAAAADGVGGRNDNAMVCHHRALGNSSSSSSTGSGAGAGDGSIASTANMMIYSPQCIGGAAAPEEETIDDVFASSVPAKQLIAEVNRRTCAHHSFAVLPPPLSAHAPVGSGGRTQNSITADASGEKQRTVVLHRQRQWGPTTTPSDAHNARHGPSSVSPLHAPAAAVVTAAATCTTDVTAAEEADAAAAAMARLLSVAAAPRGGCGAKKKENAHAHASAVMSDEKSGHQQQQQCDHCGKRFATAVLLRRHVQSKHVHEMNLRTLSAALAAATATSSPSSSAAAVPSAAHPIEALGPHARPSHHRQHTDASASPSIQSQFQRSLAAARADQHGLCAAAAAAAASPSPYVTPNATPPTAVSSAVGSGNGSGEAMSSSAYGAQQIVLNRQKAAPHFSFVNDLMLPCHEDEDDGDGGGGGGDHFLFYGTCSASASRPYRGYYGYDGTVSGGHTAAAHSGENTQRRPHDDDDADDFNFYDGATEHFSSHPTCTTTTQTSQDMAVVAQSAMTTTKTKAVFERFLGHADEDAADDGSGNGKGMGRRRDEPPLSLIGFAPSASASSFDGFGFGGSTTSAAPGPPMMASRTAPDVADEEESEKSGGFCTQLQQPSNRHPAAGIGLGASARGGGAAVVQTVSPTLLGPAVDSLGGGRCASLQPRTCMGMPQRSDCGIGAMEGEEDDASADDAQHIGGGPFIHAAGTNAFAADDEANNGNFYNTYGGCGGNLCGRLSPIGGGDSTSSPPIATHANAAHDDTTSISNNATTSNCIINNGNSSMHVNGFGVERGLSPSTGGGVFASAQLSTFPSSEYAFTCMAMHTPEVGAGAEGCNWFGNLLLSQTRGEEGWGDEQHCGPTGAFEFEFAAAACGFSSGAPQLSSSATASPSSEGCLLANSSTKTASHTGKYDPHPHHHHHSSALCSPHTPPPFGGCGLLHSSAEASFCSSLHHPIGGLGIGLIGLAESSIAHLALHTQHPPCHPTNSAAAAPSSCSSQGAPPPPPQPPMPQGWGSAAAACPARIIADGTDILNLSMAAIEDVQRFL